MRFAANAKKIAVFSSRNYDNVHLTLANQNLKGNLDITFIESALKEETIRLAEGYDAVCVFVNDDLNAKVLTSLKEYNINLLALRCAGYNNVDLKKAAELNIQVVRVPAYSPYAVAEHAVCLLLALNRKLKKSIDRVREGNFELEGLLGFDINGKTVGVIGTGRIGYVFAKIMTGFGAKVICCDPFVNTDIINLGLKYTSMDDILARSDIISIHSNLTEENFHLIDEAAINKMKPGVILLNVSRGGLVDTQAVINGLKSGRIGGLGIDVVEHEELVFFRDNSDEVIKDDCISRLISFNNVLFTGHQAFFTVEAIQNICNTTVENINTVFSGKDCANTIKF